MFCCSDSFELTILTFPASPTLPPLETFEAECPLTLVLELLLILLVLILMLPLEMFWVRFVVDFDADVPMPIALLLLLFELIWLDIYIVAFWKSLELCLKWLLF